MIASTGPTNTRKYTVAVYFRGERLATGTGHSIQQAEMNAATNALKDRGGKGPGVGNRDGETGVGGWGAGGRKPGDRKLGTGYLGGRERGEP